MASKDNLEEAFSGESQANRRYLAFAQQAEEDGFPQIARLFRSAAEAETIHAIAHFRVSGGISSTEENLKTAVAGEEYEFTQMYPAFLAEAREEGNKPAEFSFRNALAVEEVHFDLFSRAVKAVQEGHDIPEVPIYVCPVCGNTVEGEIPEVCPVCHVKGEKYREIL
ncbi:MAG: rubrerythrin family protein [Spirochaetes bacterium]|nr:MAG: rubrerythrin family protein [Spirochaetota bacterium]